MIAQMPEDEMLRRMGLTPWLEQLRAEHHERAQRMIDDHWKQESDVLQARIEVILLEQLPEPATTREEWAKLKAEAIMKMLKEE